jgi:hypothetical protein
MHGTVVGNRKHPYTYSYGATLHILSRVPVNASLSEPHVQSRSPCPVPGFLVPTGDVSSGFIESVLTL